MKYFLGIDGGGSKTNLCVINEHKKIVKTYKSGPSSIDTVEIDTTFSNAILKVNAIPYTFSGIHFGVGGVNTEDDINLCINLLKQIENVSEDVVLSASNDVFNLYYNLLEDKEGIVLISGTGSVCYGKCKDNDIRIGGYGYKEGDFGSGYCIGQMALQLACKFLDGRVKNSELSKRLLTYLKIKDYVQMADYISKSTRTQVASLASFVLDNYRLKDAKDIIDFNIDELFAMVVTAKSKLKLKDNFSYGFGGGVLNNLYFKNKLVSKIREAYGEAKLIENNNPISYGAAKLALDNYERL